MTTPSPSAAIVASAIVEHLHAADPSAFTEDETRIAERVQSRMGPRSPVSAARAREIIEQARALTATAFRDLPGAWVESLDRVLQPGERSTINDAWGRLPGNTSFVGALERIAAGKLDASGPAPVSERSALLTRLRALTEEASALLSKVGMAHQSDLLEAMPDERALAPTAQRDLETLREWETTLIAAIQKAKAEAAAPKDILADTEAAALVRRIVDAQQLSRLDPMGPASNAMMILIAKLLAGAPLDLLERAQAFAYSRASPRPRMGDEFGDLLFSHNTLVILQSATTTARDLERKPLTALAKFYAAREEYQQEVVVPFRERITGLIENGFRAPWVQPFMETMGWGKAEAEEWGTCAYCTKRWALRDGKLPTHMVFGNTYCAGGGEDASEVALAKVSGPAAPAPLIPRDTPINTLYDIVLPKITAALNHLIPHEPSGFTHDDGVTAALILYGDLAFISFLRQNGYDLSPDGTIRWLVDFWKTTEARRKRSGSHLPPPFPTDTPDFAAATTARESAETMRFLDRVTGIPGWRVVVGREHTYNDFSAETFMGGEKISHDSNKIRKAAVAGAITSWKVNEFIWRHWLAPFLGRRTLPGGPSEGEFGGAGLLQAALAPQTHPPLTVPLSAALRGELWALEGDTYAGDGTDDRGAFVAALTAARGGKTITLDAAARRYAVDRNGALRNSLDIWSSASQGAQTAQHRAFTREATALLQQIESESSRTP